MKDKNKLFGSLKRLKLKETSSEQEPNLETIESEIKKPMEDSDIEFDDTISEIENDGKDDVFDEIMDIINDDIPIPENSNKEYIDREDALREDSTEIEEFIEPVELKTDEVEFEFEEPIETIAPEFTDLEEIQPEFEENKEIETPEFTDLEEIQSENLLKQLGLEDVLLDEDNSNIDETDEFIDNIQGTELEVNLDYEENTPHKKQNETEIEETKNPFDINEEVFNEDIDEPYDESPEYSEEYSFEDDSETEEYSFEDNSEMEEKSYEPEFIYSEENEELKEEYSNYYKDSEIDSKRGKKRKNKDIFLKIIIGIIALGVIAGLAFGARYLINNKDKLVLDKSTTEENVETETPTNVPKIEVSTPTPIVKEEDETSIETEHSGLNVETEIKDIEEQIPEKEEVSSFIQTFTGYIVDINNTDIYVSDKITEQELSLLTNDFEEYMSGTDTKVYIEKSETNNETAEIEDTNTEENEEPEIIIIGAPTEEETTETEEDSNIPKIYHANSVCEYSMKIDMSPVKLSSLDSSYVECEHCGYEITPSNNTVLDYDYSELPELASIIYKKFNVNAETIPDWATIGSKITISYMQNADTYLNDIIEISRAKTNTDLNTGFVDGNNPQTGQISQENDYRDSDMNIFGADFEAIVAKINDRNKGKEQFTGNILDEELKLEASGTRESVSSSINIGACDYVWIQILWKKNGDTKSIPDVDDVIVELQTPGGSLINDSNLNQYGKKWINKKVINYVMKNPKTGNWKVLFTKDVGTYLGDVTIQAAPMTGFLQINKAAAKYTDGKLKCIWQATGIADDYCKVQIFARNGNNDILLYSGNTIDDDIRTVDMVDIDAAKIAGNIYDIVFKITDIDVSAGEPKQITYQFITDEYVVENIEIPSMK